MTGLYPVIQFLELADEAEEALVAARNKAERVGLPECAGAISRVIDEFNQAVGLLLDYEVKKRE